MLNKKSLQIAVSLALSLSGMSALGIDYDAQWMTPAQMGARWSGSGAAANRVGRGFTATGAAEVKLHPNKISGRFGTFIHPSCASHLTAEGAIQSQVVEGNNQYRFSQALAACITQHPASSSRYIRARNASVTIAAFVAPVVTPPAPARQITFNFMNTEEQTALLALLPASETVDVRDADGCHREVRLYVPARAEQSGSQVNFTNPSSTSVSFTLPVATQDRLNTGLSEVCSNLEIAKRQGERCRVLRANLPGVTADCSGLDISGVRVVSSTSDGEQVAIVQTTPPVTAPAASAATDNSEAPAATPEVVRTRPVGTGLRNRDANREETERMISTCVRGRPNAEDIQTAESLLATLRGLTDEDRYNRSYYRILGSKIRMITRGIQRAEGYDLEDIAEALLDFARDNEDALSDSENLSADFRAAIIDIANKLASPTRRNRDSAPRLSSAIRILEEANEFFLADEDQRAIDTRLSQLEIDSVRNTCARSGNGRFVGMECSTAAYGLANGFYREMVGAFQMQDQASAEVARQNLFTVVGNGSEQPGLIQTAVTQRQQAYEQEQAFKAQFFASMQSPAQAQAAGGGRLNTGTSVASLGVLTNPTGTNF